MDKLIVLDLFVEVDLIRALAPMYDPSSKIVRTTKGIILVDISPMEILNSFSLARHARVDIDDKRFEHRYQLRKEHYREKEVEMFRKRDWHSEVAPIIPIDKEPFVVYSFEKYFTKTYYALCYILGEDAGAKIPLGILMMGIKI